MVKRKSVPWIVLAVIMTLAMAMPMKASAATEEMTVRYYDASGTVQTVTLVAADSTEIRLSDDSYISWNGSGKALHLSNMNLAAVSSAYAISSSFLSPINIKLDGTNSISGTTGYGISASHTINITGPGSLDIKSHENGYAIKTLGLLSVSSGATITADCEISSNSYMNISNSTVTTTSSLICFATLNISGNSDVSAYGATLDNALVVYPDTGKLLEVKTGTSETDATHVNGSPFGVATNCGRMSGVSYFHVKEHNHSYNGYEANDTQHWQKCTDCGALTAAEAHTPTTINAKDATCMEAGYTGDTVCSVCGYEIAKGSATTALGHDYTNYVSNNDASCTTDGTKTAKCNRGCGATDTLADTGSALGHDFASAWSSDADAHWHACTRCGAAGEKAAHTLTTVIDKAATATEAGSKHEQCSVCGYAKAAVQIPATGGGSTGASSGASSSTAKLATTGDAAAPLAAAALALVGVTLTAAGLSARRR